jgi:hypothetical protein
MLEALPRIAGSVGKRSAEVIWGTLAKGAPLDTLESYYLLDG